MSAKIAMRKFVFVLITLFLILLASAEGNSAHHHDKKATQKSYVCPPNFMRLSYKCYFFSNTTATWQEAYWKCRDMKSNIATIKNGNQDKIIRRTLDHDALVPYERWIGGRYDWGTSAWKWAASGREIQFQGFEEGLPTEKEALDWHCIILDPKKHYRWGSRSCTAQKHFICQTKMRKVDNKDKKKMQQQYLNKLNEVAVPDIISNNIIPVNNTFSNYLNDNNQLDNNAPAYRPRELKIRKKNKKDTSEYGKHETSLTEKRLRNRANRLRKNKQHRDRAHDKKEPNNVKRKIRYMTYYEATKNPLHPRVAVEEFSYSKNTK